MAYIPNERKQFILSKLREIVEGKKMTITELAAFKAKEWHQAVNQKYDGKDYYETHICDVVRIARSFIEIIPINFRDNVIAGAYLHDSIEDTNKTYNDVLKIFGFQIAELAYALTNNKGRTREERADWRYYRGIRKTKYATFDKLADRISNVNYSKKTNSSMYNTYKLSNDKFIRSLEGTNTWFGIIRYWFKTKFNLHEANYDAMYGTLERLSKEKEFIL